MYTTTYTFDSLIDEDWMVHVDRDDINEPYTCRADEGIFGKRWIGPLVKVPVGSTEVDEDGEEVLDLSGPDGRNLAAVACLPEIARLFHWINEQYVQLSDAEDSSYAQMVDELIDRIIKITRCIDQRPETLEVGFHSLGPEK